jgi:hypothetical protein
MALRDSLVRLELEGYGKGFRPAHAVDTTLWDRRQLEMLEGEGQQTCQSQARHELDTSRLGLARPTETRMQGKYLTLADFC